MKKPHHHQRKVNTAEDQHLSYPHIVQYIQGELNTLDAQLTGHHIMNCGRCENIWEKLIRQLNEKPEIRPTYLQTMRTLLL